MHAKQMYINARFSEELLLHQLISAPFVPPADLGHTSLKGVSLFRVSSCTLIHWHADYHPAARTVLRVGLCL